MSLPRKRESTIADFLDSRFCGNDAKRCSLGENRSLPAEELWRVSSQRSVNPLLFDI